MAQVPPPTAENPARRILPVTGHKFFLLFLFLLSDLALYPYVGDTGARYRVFRMVGAAVTLMSVYAVSFRRGLIFVALILAGPAIVEHAIVFRPRMVPASVFTVVLSFAFDVFIIVVIFRRVFAREEPTAETIFGAVCIYLLIGFSFARLYAIVAIIQPHAFYLDPAINPHGCSCGFRFYFFQLWKHDDGRRGWHCGRFAAGPLAVHDRIHSGGVVSRGDDFKADGCLPAKQIRLRGILMRRIEF